MNINHNARVYNCNHSRVTTENVVAGSTFFGYVPMCNKCLKLLSKKRYLTAKEAIEAVVTQ